MDEREDAFSPGKPYQLFFMSKQMIRTLAGLTRDLEDPVYLKPVSYTHLDVYKRQNLCYSHKFARYVSGFWHSHAKTPRGIVACDCLLYTSRCV